VSDAPESPPGGFRLHRDAWGRLVLTRPDGSEFAGVVPVRGFPFSAPRHGISLRDATGREIVWIENLDALPTELQGEIEAELAEREFMPVIRRIRHIQPRLEPSEWEVETDRGPTRFVLNTADDVRRLDDYRATIVDANGVRYLVLDMHKLDGTSRRFLERYL
jgi:hypothetical protein